MLARCNDLNVAWSEVGRGTPLVLIHGLADDHRAWRRALTYLVLQHRVVLYDLRGHGETSLGQPDGSLRQLGEDLIALLDGLDLESPYIAGFSLGGTIAMRVAIDHPERVGGLALIATSSRVGRAAADWYRERAAMVERNDPRLRETLDQDTADVYAQAPGELDEGLLIRRQSTADPRGFANACTAMAGLNTAPLDPELQRISARTLIVAADLDHHCPPKAAQIIASVIDGTAETFRLEIIAGVGHAIPVEKPRELAAAINSFLADD